MDEGTFCAHLLSDRPFIKETFASVRSRSSSAISSTSMNTFDPFGLVACNFCFLAKHRPPTECYQLNVVVNDTREPYNNKNHKNSCYVIREKLAPFLESIGGTVTFSETSTKSPTWDDQLWTSGMKLPDVSWYYEDEKSDVILQIEVVSSRNLERTLRTLALGLIDQHRSWKNRHPQLSRSIVGYCFPVTSIDPQDADVCGRCVHRVECHWREDIPRFRYTITAFPLPANDAIQNIVDVAEAQRVWFSQNVHSSTSNSHFTLPLSPDFIQSNFGPSAFQVRSGESIVILNNEFAFKRPLRSCNHMKLFEMTFLDPSLPESCATPINSIMAINVFFKFNRYVSPLGRSRARIIFSRFFVILLDAINEIHGAGIAHLDVRLENICFTEVGKVVLIDLDRSLPINYPAEELPSQYGQSLMYDTGNDDWTCEQQDMRQLAILIGYIAGNDNVHNNPPNQHLHSYVQKLYNDGQC